MTKARSIQDSVVDNRLSSRIPRVLRSDVGSDALLSSIIKIIALPVSAVAGLVGMRVFSQNYGATGLALYGLVLSIPLLLPFADMGLGATATEIVATRKANSRDAVAASLRTIVRRLLVPSGILIGASILIGGMGWWGSIVGTSLSGVNAACSLTLAIFGLNIPIALGYRILLGFQRNRTVVLLQSMVTLLGALSVSLLSWLRLPIALVISSPQLIALVGSLFACMLARRHLQWAGILSQDTRSLGRADSYIGRMAIANLVIGLCLPMCYQSGRIILSHFSNTEQLAILVAAGQLFFPINSVLQAAGQTLWPYFSSLRRDARSFEYLGRVVRMAFVFGIASALFGAGVILFGPTLTNWATSGQAVPSRSVFMSFALLIVAVGVNLPVGMSMMGRGAVQLQAALFVIAATATVSGSILFANNGAIAPPLVLAISLTVFVTIPALFSMRLRTRTHVNELGRRKSPESSPDNEEE